MRGGTWRPACRARERGGPHPGGKQGADPADSTIGFSAAQLKGTTLEGRSHQRHAHRFGNHLMGLVKFALKVNLTRLQQRFECLPVLS